MASVEYLIKQFLSEDKRTLDLSNQNLGDEGALDPDAIADAFWMLHTQPRSAWTLELDLRPYKESF